MFRVEKKTENAWTPKTEWFTTMEELSANTAITVSPNMTFRTVEKHEDGTIDVISTFGRDA